MTATAPPLDELTIAAFHRGIFDGSITSVALVDAYLARIARHDGAGAELQAVVTVNPDARKDARALDEAYAATGALVGPLHGVPVLVKDQALTAGLRTTFGSILFKDYVPLSDATVVSKLREAGAVILAKTSMCDLAAGWFSTSSMTGHTKNPYDLTRESGGSSAGSAAGVAANFGMVGIGEDTGGSIRIPASFNNLFGLRVTTGLISRAGFSPLVHFQDTPGPIGRTVTDVATVLDCIVGYDPLDPFTVTATSASPVGGYERALADSIPISRWRVGVLESAFGSNDSPDSEAVNRVVRSAISHLQQLGVRTVADVEIDDLNSWIANTSVYHKQSKADLTSFFAELPGAPATSFSDLYNRGQFHPSNDLLHGIAEGPDDVADDAEYMRLRLNQEHFRRLILNLLAGARLDFLVYPTVQIIPPTRDDIAAGHHPTLTFPTNTVIASQAGLPAFSIPIGFTPAGLPVGLEVLARPMAERELLQFAHAWEKAVGPRRAPTMNKSLTRAT